MAFSPDSQTTDVVIGQPGAVKPCRGEPCVRPNDDIEGALSNAGPNSAVGAQFITPENTRVAISTSVLPQPAVESADPQLTAPISGVINHAPTIRTASVGAQFIAPFIRSAHAQEIILPPLGPGAPGVEGLCSRPDVTCCPVNPDGSFECAVRLVDASAAQLYIAAISPDGRIGPSITERIQSNAFYFKASAHDITSGPDGAWYGVTENQVGVEVGTDNNRYAVRGNDAANYQAVEARDATNIVFNETALELAFRKPLQAISKYPVSLATGIDVNRLQDITVPDTREYTVLKKTFDGGMWFGREPVSPMMDEWIYDTSNGTNIRFLAQLDIATAPLLTCKKVITFDVDTDGYAIVVFEDGDGNVRIRVGHRRDDRLLRFGGVNPVGDFQFSDLQIYRENIDPTATGLGRALLLEPRTNRIYQLAYSYQSLPASIEFGTAIDLGNGKNPQDFVFNTNRDRAFVVNQGDDTLTVLPLKDQAGNLLSAPQIQAAMIHVPLKSFIENKDFILQPNAIDLQRTGGREQLLISTRGLKGALVIPVTDVQGNLP